MANQIEKESEQERKNINEANAAHMRQRAMDFFASLRTKISQYIADGKVKKLWMQQTGLTVRDIGLYTLGILTVIIII